jgi:methyl-accepting chemotaxis protein
MGAGSATIILEVQNLSDASKAVESSMQEISDAARTMSELATQVSQLSEENESRIRAVTDGIARFRTG